MEKLQHKRRLANRFVLAISAAMLLALLSATAFAQATGGTIKGTVSDQNGAVIPGATITVKNQSTGVTSPVFKSTSDGIYVVPGLNPGKYSLSVQSASFKTALYTDIDVRLGEDAVIDVQLQAGGSAETVTITASTETAIQKDTSQISANFQSRQVQDLPSNVAGAGLDTLALLVPGVTPGFSGATNTNGTALSVNGNRTRSNNFTIDGQDNNDLSIGGPVFFVDNQDSVADFQVVTNNFSAQYGRNQGAIVNIVLKSGTNQFHGTAFEYHRDRSNFDSLDNLEKSSGLSGPNPLLYNVFGGTVGGPIKKDRIFFFGSYQGTQTREIFTAIPGVTEAPQLAILPEDLPALAQAFPGNAAIANYVKYSAFAINDLGTVRAIPGSEDTITLNGRQFRAAIPERSFQAPAASPYSGNEFSGRVDTKLTDKDSLWGRYLFQQTDFKNALGTAGGFTGDIPARSQNVGVTWDRQLRSNSLNDLSFNYTHLYLNFGGGCNGLTGCIPDPSQIDQAFTNLSFPGVRGDNSGLPLQTVGPNPGFPQGRIVNIFQFRDNYSFTHGRHQLMAGVDIRRLTNQNEFLPNLNGQFSFRSANQLVNNSAGVVTLGQGPSTVKYNETDEFFFFQDDWKIKDNFTLNLGIRYEFTGQPINTLHDLSVKRESDPNTALWLQSLPLSARTVPSVPSDKNNFAPRVGFAYTPHFWKKLLGEDATVIRGGFSIAYDPRSITF